jgi:hypothetical protein
MVVPVVLSSAFRRHSIESNVGDGGRVAQSGSVNGNVVVVVLVLGTEIGDVEVGPCVVVGVVAVDVEVDDEPGTVVVDACVVVVGRIVVPAAMLVVVEEVVLVVVGGIVTTWKRLTESDEPAVV